MKYSTRTGSPAQFRTDCLIVTKRRARSVARALGVLEFVDHALGNRNNQAGTATVIAIPTAVKNLVVVGGDEKSSSPDAYQKSIAAAANTLRGLTITSAVWCLNDLGVDGKDAYWKARNALAALSSALYWFDDYKSKPSKAARLRRVSLLADGRSRSSIVRAVRHGQALDDGLELARNLGNHPPNVCTPTYLAREARKMSRLPGVSVRVLEERHMTELGMGAFMSVTRGTETPAKMIIVSYQGGKAADSPIVLVGKGITFDTGGISLKSSGGMEQMKFDMCGAACVLGTIKAAITAKLPINVISIVAAAENMPGGAASRPSDIVTTLSGQTVEILNTDAEGRLVLCDTLTYAARFKPRSVVDVATLTGAAIVALGSHASALYSNDESLGAALASAGQDIWDRAWSMPLWDEYNQQLSSAFADMTNVGGREAGSITAACFLSRFTKDFPWAHIDVAGTAFRSGARKGSTGRPVPLLFQYLLDQAA
ncbi:MAG: leucyl aminopeptidase [Gammaproteobacteria bacterium]|nr:leucyl aminopeptidase [Gammaproteobacteria bacterium]